MRLHAVWMLGLLALAGGAEVQAQGAPHVCGGGPGPNEVQAGVQPGGNGMAPTPLCYWKQDQQAQQPSAPPQPTGYWEKTWGAIATSETGGALGTAIGFSDKEQAEQIAMQDCKAKGGGGCKIGLSYHNQCAVMLVGNDVTLSRAASIEEAKADGMQACEARGDNCRVYYSACTEPIFHHY